MNYRVIRSSRKTLALVVKPDGTVLVRSPRRVSGEEIGAFVAKHLDWIEKKQQELAQRQRQRAAVTPLTALELEVLAQAAVKDLDERVRRFAEILQVSYGRVTIRNQKTKWGSCSSKGNLNFNCLLMLAPAFVRDYVVVHELCHRKEMNHSPRFWAEVEAVLPDYQVARKWLRANGEALMSRNPG